MHYYFLSCCSTVIFGYLTASPNSVKVEEFRAKEVEFHCPLGSKMISGYFESKLDDGSHVK